MSSSNGFLEPLALPVAEEYQRQAKTEWSESRCRVLADKAQKEESSASSCPPMSTSLETGRHAAKLLLAWQVLRVAQEAKVSLADHLANQGHARNVHLNWMNSGALTMDGYMSVCAHSDLGELLVPMSEFMKELESTETKYDCQLPNCIYRAEMRLIHSWQTSACRKKTAKKTPCWSTFRLLCWYYSTGEEDWDVIANDMEKAKFEAFSNRVATPGDIAKAVMDWGQTFLLTHHYRKLQ